MSEIVLRAQGLHKRYTEGGLDVPVPQSVDLEVRAGETLAIVGTSGSGKSTLLHLFGGLEAPSQGSVQLMGRDFTAMSAAGQGEWRNRQLGFVYQFHHLLPEFTAIDKVAMPLRIRRDAVPDAPAQTQAVLVHVGLAARLEHRPAQLAGAGRPARLPACLPACSPTRRPATSTAVRPRACWS